MINKKTFNILDIFIVKQEFTKDELVYIQLKYKNANMCFKDEVSFEKFIQFLKKSAKPNKTEVIFAYNLSFFFLSLLRYKPDIKDNFYINSFLENCTTYYFSLELKTINAKFVFKCASKFLPETSITASDKNTYTNFGRYIITEKITNIEINVPRLINHRVHLLNSELQQIDKFIFPFYKKWIHYSYSLSSVAINIYKFNFMCIPIKLENSLAEDERFRIAFYGGRCEVFGNRKSTNEQIFHFDFRSMYGEIMKGDFPQSNYVIENAPLSINKPGFYYVKLLSMDEHLPVLPHRSMDETEKYRGVLYTNGTFEGLYWYEELELFQKYGGKILEIKYAYVFTDDFEPLFKDYAIMCDKNREISDIAKIFWKSVLVSFYGRLGMGPKKTETKLITELEYRNLKDKKKIIKENWIQDYVIVEIEKEPNVNNKLSSNVIYAAIITSRARVRLYKALKSVINNGGRLLYCDTDSIFAAYTHNVLGKKHGEIYWDPTNKNTVLDDAVFASIRTYTVKKKDTWTTKIAGIARNSISFKEFYNSFYGLQANVFFANIPQENIFKDWIGDNALRKGQEIIYLDNYNKRIFNDNKNITTPLFVNNGKYVPNPFT
jgi:hypothetical protein